MRHGARRGGREDEKRWLCWRSRSGSVKRERKAIETKERREGKREARDRRDE